jgi:DNA-binding NarL/FixJ family response regulator
MVIIENNLLQAELLHYFCTQCWGLKVEAVVKTGSEGIAAVARIKPDVVLAALPPSDLGLSDFIKQLRNAAPAAKLILLTEQCNEYFVHIVGAMDYHALVLVADESLSTLGQVIQRVRLGTRFISDRIARLQAALWAAPASFPKLLSKREEQVLVCIAHALSDDEIALQLGFTPGTALSHRRRLMDKLNIHSTPKLIRYCADKGFNLALLPKPPQREAGPSK